MSFTFDDESRLWAIFDTCTKPHYYQDVHNLLAAPQGWVLRYEYRHQWVADDALAVLRDQAPLPRYILFGYVQHRTYGRGMPAPAPNATETFEDYLWVPTRMGRMLNVVASGQEYYFDFRVLGYPAGGPATFRELFARQATPFWKWVSLVATPSAPAAEEAAATDDAWRTIVDTLGAPPCQFAGDVFWRLVSLRRTGDTTALAPTEHQEKSAGEIRQVSTLFRLKEDQVYVVEASSCRSPQSRNGQAYQPYRLAASTSNPDVLGVVGTGSFDLRQYTGLHVEMEAKQRELLKEGRTELLLRTEPRDGDWPQGPQLHLRIVVSKNWFLSGAGAVAALVGVVLGLDAVVAFFKGQGGWLPLLSGAGGVLLTAIGATVLTGKLQVKL